MHLKKKKTSPQFEDESHNKITFKPRDFYSANVFKNVKTTFNNVGRRSYHFQTIFLPYIFAFTLGSGYFASSPKIALNQTEVK